MIAGLLTLAVAILATAGFTGSRYLVPDSTSAALEKADLEGRTSQFLRYARNEIYARHGHPFNKNDLRVYFQNQPWYKPGSRPSALSPTEQANVDLIRSLEDARQGPDLMKVVWRSELGGWAAFYVAEGLWKNASGGYDWPYDYINGHFALLPKEMDWALPLKTVPPEWVVANAAHTGEIVSGMGEALRPDHIRLLNLDEGCTADRGTEIFVESENDSDYVDVAFLGFDPEGEFRILLETSGYLSEVRTLCPDRVLVTVSARVCLSGFTWGTLYHILYDPETAQAHSVPLRYIDDGPTGRTCLQSVPFYFDEMSASQREESARIGVVPVGARVDFVGFYLASEPGAAHVVGEGVDGWISLEDFSPKTFDIYSAG